VGSRRRYRRGSIIGRRGSMSTYTAVMSRHSDACSPAVLRSSAFPCSRTTIMHTSRASSDHEHTFTRSRCVCAVRGACDGPQYKSVRALHRTQHDTDVPK
jgi:hypothetical protein